ncbi:MAG: hypothetical protein RMH77_04715 [Sulfolobales archaeon]|nr:hypothetical protein [Sulfolobales archaeon]MDW7969686.1 hypothetical protein [Sulfolobales archaeon]
MVGKKKATGKIVHVKKSRRTIRVNRKLLIALVAVVAVILSGYVLSSSIRGGSPTTQQSLKPYEIIEQLTTSDNVTAILVYTASGNLALRDKVLGVYDRLVFILQPAKMQLPSTDEEGKNITIRYYIVRYDTSHYLSNYLLSKLGTTPFIENLSQLIVDEDTLRLMYGELNTSELGSINMNSKVLGGIEARLYRIEVNASTINIYREVKYGLPVEVAYFSGNEEIKLTLNDVIKY